MRLGPALLTMVSVCVVAGAILLPNPERHDLIPQAIAAVLSYSNIQLWLTTGGYWAASSEDIVLLHTWSLSVEEQFYLLFPIFLAFMLKSAPQRLRASVLVLFFASLGFCLVATETSRSAAFYLLPSRMWELLAGAILAIFQLERRFLRGRPILEFLQPVALVVLLGSFFLIENDKNFPSWRPLVPCLCTVFLISRGSSISLIQRILGTRSLVGIGRMSYSLYLWHWPAIVFSRYLSADHYFEFSLVSMLILSASGYFLVERPLRYRSHHFKRILKGGAVGFAMAILPLCLLRTPPLLPSSLGQFDAAPAISVGKEYEASRFAKSQSPSAIVSDGNQVICVVGSSHARVLCKPIDSAVQDQDYQFVSLCTSGVGITANRAGSLRKKDQAQLNAERIQLIQQIKPGIIIIGGKWNSELVSPSAKERFQKFVTIAATNCEQLILVGQAPQLELQWPYVRSPRKYWNARARSRLPLEVASSGSAEEANAFISSEVSHGRYGKNVRFCDAASLMLTDDGQVQCFRDGEVIYADDHHLNERGASLVFRELLSPMIFQSERSSATPQSRIASGASGSGKGGPTLQNRQLQ